MYCPTPKLGLRFVLKYLTLSFKIVNLFDHEPFNQKLPPSIFVSSVMYGAPHGKLLSKTKDIIFNRKRKNQAKNMLFFILSPAKEKRQFYYVLLDNFRC
jgi:hypothetical protein